MNTFYTKVGFVLLFQLVRELLFKLFGYCVVFLGILSAYSASLAVLAFLLRFTKNAAKPGVALLYDAAISATFISLLATALLFIFRELVRPE